MATSSRSSTNPKYGREDGFHHVNVPHGVKRITATVQVSPTTFNDYDRALELEITSSLGHKIAEVLISDNLLEITKVAPDAYKPYDIEFVAQLTVVDKQLTTVISPEKCMIWKDKEWTEEQIIYALSKTYPEYLI